MGTKEELVVNEFRKLCNDMELKHFPELNTIIVTYYEKLNQENKAYFRLKLVAELSNE
ncbi:bacteriocin immunity protein [Streptococcus uberis]|nr:bacteriocin immunity protein [Streptococcus uberis]